MLQVIVAVPAAVPVESSTSPVNEKVPGLVGVPPKLPPALVAIPGGSTPPETKMV
jgi:hypothetical protein